MSLSQDQLKALVAQLKRNRQEPKGDSSDVLSGAKLLRDMISQCSDDEDVVTLMTLLVSEYSWYGLQSEQESVLREMVQRFPEEPVPWISLANFLMYEQGRLSEANNLIDVALQKAIVSGTFVQHVYNARARIAARLGNFALLQDTLQRSLTLKSDDTDVGREFEFLKDLPEGAIDSDVRAQYLRLAEKQELG